MKPRSMNLGILMLVAALALLGGLFAGEKVTAKSRKKSSKKIIIATHEIKENEITLKALDGKVYKVVNTNSRFAKAMFRTEEKVLYVTVKLVKGHPGGGDVRIGEWAGDAWNEESENLKVKYASVLLKLDDESTDEQKLAEYR